MVRLSMGGESILAARPVNPRPARDSERSEPRSARDSDLFGHPRPSLDWAGIVPRQGERMVIVGQTGSGKTSLTTHILQLMPNSPVVIYDTKTEPKFEYLPNSVITTDESELAVCVNDPQFDYIIHRPHVDMLAEWRELDELLYSHYNNLTNADAYIDELLSFHGTTGQYGHGLVALYTRGRSRGITTIAATQRPSRVSKFSLSEAQTAAVFHLNSAGDRKKVSDEVGMPEQANPPPWHFWHWRAGSTGEPVLYAPAPLLAGIDAGYTDPVEVVTDAGPAPALDGHVWLGPRKFWTLS